MTKIEFNKPYAPKKRVYTDVDPHSLTKQAHAAECDINHIMARYEKTGIINHVRENITPRYGDFTDVEDYQSSLQKVIDAQQSFMALDARIRKRFANDPAQFLSFLEDKKNYDEAVALGLIDKKVNSDFSANEAKKDAGDITDQLPT